MVQDLCKRHTQEYYAAFISSVKERRLVGVAVVEGEDKVRLMYEQGEKAVRRVCAKTFSTFRISTRVLCMVHKE